LNTGGGELGRDCVEDELFASSLGTSNWQAKNKKPGTQMAFGAGHGTNAQVFSVQLSNYQKCSWFL
jgi:hypothetical protein